MRTVAAIVRSARPGQWVKNVLVFAPLVFAQQALEPRAVGRTLAAFALFCLASGAVYLVNDLLDRDQDRRHPLKRGAGFRRAVSRRHARREHGRVRGPPEAGERERGAEYSLAAPPPRDREGRGACPRRGALGDQGGRVRVLPQLSWDSPAQPR